jgi:hypothetical protein
MTKTLELSRKKIIVATELDSDEELLVEVEHYEGCEDHYLNKSEMEALHDLLGHLLGRR